MSESLKNLSDGLAGVVETASAGIVRVEARRRLPASGVIWSDDGLIVTAHHVIEDDEQIRVGLPDGESVAATLVGRDPGSDLAVLRVDTALSAPAWDAADDLKVGHLVLALGRPGANVQATLGVVSAIGVGEPAGERKSKREHKGHRRRGFRGPGRRGGRFGRGGPGMFWMQMGPMRQTGGAFIWTDVVMYPGFSGGPLVDAGGQIRGINSSGLMRGTSVALPTAAVSKVVDTLKSHGRIRRGFLGVSAQAVSLSEAQAEELDQDSGLLLVSVEPESPAERGGLLVGDILVTLDGESVSHLEELLALLAGERVGKTVTLRLIRGGQLTDAEVTLAERV